MTDIDQCNFVRGEEMEKSEIRIRTAKVQDAEELLKIYAPYVKNTAITFEYEIPSVNEFAGRIEHVLKRYPYLVAERKGEIVGYAYVSPFHERAAYDWAVETSIYLRQDMKRMGIGSILYAGLEETLRRMNILNLNACIAYPETEDEHLTKASVEFHQRLGYRMVGEFHQCGYKFDRWYNMVWMEKMIGVHLEHQPAVIPYPEL